MAVDIEELRVAALALKMLRETDRDDTPWTVEVLPPKPRPTTLPVSVAEVLDRCKLEEANLIDQDGDGHVATFTLECDARLAAALYAFDLGAVLALIEEVERLRVERDTLRADLRADAAACVGESEAGLLAGEIAGVLGLGVDDAD